MYITNNMSKYDSTSDTIKPTPDTAGNPDLDASEDGPTSDTIKPIRVGGFLRNALFPGKANTEDSSSEEE